MSLAEADSLRSGTNTEERVDRFGMFASGLCAVHCAVAAFLPATFGVLGVGFLSNPLAEWIFTGLAIAFAAGTLAFGWRRHRSTAVAMLLSAGIVGLLASRVLESGEGHHHGHGEDDAHEHGNHDEHGGHEEHGAGHLAGTLVGVLAGGLLLGGHMLNIRELRCCEEDACSTG